MEDLIAVVLAAGKGTRMKTEKAKVVHKVYGKEMIKRVVETAHKAGIKDIVTIVGHKREEVEEVLGDSVIYAYQDELLGTGHTTMQAIPYLKDKKGKVVILYGDVPIVRPETLQKLIAKNIKEKEDATVLTAIVNNPKRIWKNNKRRNWSCKGNSRRKGCNIRGKEYNRNKFRNILF